MEDDSKNKQDLKSICLIQISRMGDIIQTIQAAQALKLTHPDVKLYFIGRKKFSLPLANYIEDVFYKSFYIDTEALKSKSPYDAFLYIDKFIKKVNHYKISVTINLTFSTTSSYLLGLLNSQYKLGAERQADDHLVINDKWSQFVYSNVMGGPHNPFNLTDIFFQMLKGETLGKIRHLLYPKDNIKEIQAKKNIIIHPFASHPKKRWPSSKWNEIIYHIFKVFPDVKIFLIGGNSDISEANNIANNTNLANFRSRIEILAGKCSPQDLIPYFKEAKLFIGHDSLGGHLASINNVKSLTIALGTVRAVETVPYGENNYVVTSRVSCYPCFPDDPCNYYECHHDINYQVIRTIISCLLNTVDINFKNIQSELSDLSLNSINLYKTTISNSGLELIPIINRPFTIEETFNTTFKIIWNVILCDADIEITNPKVLDHTVKQLARYLEGIEKFYELNEFGHKYTSTIFNTLVREKKHTQETKDLIKKIEEIDQLAMLLKKTFPLLSPLIDYYHVKKANLIGDDLINITNSLSEVYKECNLATSALYELINKVVNHNTTKSNTKNETITTNSLDN